MATKATEIVEEPTTAIEVFDGDSSASSDARAMIQGFKSGNIAIHSSFKGDDFFETAKAQLAATSNSKPLADNLNQEIKLANYVLQYVEIPDEKTGELHESVRVTLVDESGASYHATSTALANSLSGVISALGGKEPAEWPAGFSLPIKVVESRSRRGFRFMEIVVVL